MPDDGALPAAAAMGDAAGPPEAAAAAPAPLATVAQSRALGEVVETLRMERASCGTRARQEPLGTGAIERHRLPSGAPTARPIIIAGRLNISTDAQTCPCPLIATERLL